MAKSGAQSIAIDECMALEVVGEIARDHHIGFIGNFHVSRVLFEESEAVTDDVMRCLNAGQQFPGYVFGLGGPLTQHISIPRLEEAISTYSTRRNIKHIS